MRKTIRFNALSIRQVERAMRQVEAFGADLESRFNQAMAALVAEGEALAITNIFEERAVYTGELAESIQGAYNPETGIGIIWTDCEYASYVEFGTGVVGAGSPHPESGLQKWTYDINEHGESGWWYFNDRDGRTHWTKGMKSRPFMWETATELSLKVDNIIKGVMK